MDLDPVIVAMLATLVFCGCATEAQHPAAGAAKPTTEQEIGKSEPRDTLLPKCRVPCNVTPGPGCC
jgi:hypothetical protein